MAGKPDEVLIREMIADELGVDVEEVTNNARLRDDLGGDSLDHVEMVMRIEEEFEIEISDDDAEKLMTVGELISFVEKRLKNEND